MLQCRLRKLENRMRNATHPMDRMANQCVHGCWFTLAIGKHCEPLKKVQRQTLATRLSLGVEDSLKKKIIDNNLLMVIVPEEIRF